MIAYAVLSRWVEVVIAEDGQRYWIMEVAGHYPDARLRDVVAHVRVPSVPNVGLALMVCAPAVGAALEADARYDGLILWRGELRGVRGAWERTDVLDAVDVARLRAGLVRLGLSAGAAVTIAGAAEGRTRAEVCEALIARARALASAR
jgi:hypothetical protein